MTRPDAVSIGQRVARLRDQHDPPLSQEELAVLADVSRSTVQALERGESIRTKNLVKIARALGVSRADLEDEPPLAESPEVVALARRLGMSPEDVARSITRAASRKRAV